MRLTSFNVEGIFGTFSYSLDFTDERENLSFITGPNGYGKTTILKLIEYASTGDIKGLFSINFSFLKLTYSDSFSIEIKQSKNNGFKVIDILKPCVLTFNEKDRVNFSKIVKDFKKILKEADIPKTYNADSLTNRVKFGIYQLFKDYFKKESGNKEHKELKLLEELIESLHFREKFIFKENGFDIIINKSYITFSSLSNGEKKIIRILVYLLLGCEPGSLVLIDDPETSLHVAVQMKFNEMMQKIIDLKNFQIIVSTHSPQIIDSKWEIAQDLYHLDKNIKEKN